MNDYHRKCRWEHHSGHHYRPHEKNRYKVIRAPGGGHGHCHHCYWVAHIYNEPRQYSPTKAR